jgi:hypothetical protein
MISAEGNMAGFWLFKHVGTFSLFLNKRQMLVNSLLNGTDGRSVLCIGVKPSLLQCFPIRPVVMTMTLTTTICITPCQYQLVHVFHRIWLAQLFAKKRQKINYTL